MPMPMTDAELAIAMLGLEEFTAKRRRAPSVPELGEQLRTPPTTLYHQLKILRRRGLVSWEEGKPRTLVFTDDGELALPHFRRAREEAVRQAKQEAQQGAQQAEAEPGVS